MKKPISARNHLFFFGDPAQEYGHFSGNISRTLMAQWLPEKIFLSIRYFHMPLSLHKKV